MGGVLGLTTLSEAIASGHGVERPFNCHVHPDHNASASVNVDKGLWICYACGAKGRVDDHVENPDYATLPKRIERTLAEPPQPYPESWLDLFDYGPVHPYWLGRFNEETCRHFRLGYDPSVGKPCYPLRYEDGSVAGLVYRSIDGSEPKYKYPWGIDVTKLLFNYEPTLADEVWLVEGAADAMALWECGIQDVHAIYGSELKVAQVELLLPREPERVVLAFDQDNAGMKAAMLAERLLDHWGFRSAPCRWDSKLGKDPGELPLEDRRNILVTGVAR
jgi:DNA primase